MNESEELILPIQSSLGNEPSSLHKNIEIQTIELGDVILIHASRNTNVDQQIYYVYYIDDNKVKLLNTSTKQLLQLNIDGYVADESITSIDLLSRSEVAGFARQHKLQPPQWIDVHFNGDVPVIISGEITNLEEDMIEITTYPGMRVIYVDFAYQGLPESLPIEKIVLRERPKSINTSLRSILDGTTEITREEAESEPTVEYDEMDGQMIVTIPENATPNPSPEEVIEEYLRSDIEIPSADGEDDDGELDALNMFIAVNESDRRYSEEIQVADLLGELVSKLSMEMRTPIAMKNIHKFVTRFKELRTVFSVFDENGDVIMPKVTNALHKPIIDHVMNIDRDIKWLLPVTQERNELMSVTTEKYEDSYNEAPTHIETDMPIFVNGLQSAQHNDNKYDAMMNNVDTYLTPITVLEKTPEVYIHDVDAKLPTEFIVSNDEDYHMDTSISASGPEHKSGKYRFVTRRYINGSSRLVLDETTRRRAFQRRQIGSSDKANIRSIIMLPRSVLIQSQTNSPSANMYLKSKLSEVPVYKFQIFRQKTRIAVREVENINEEIVYEDAFVGLDPENQKTAIKKGESFMKEPVHYTIADDNATPNEESFRQFLNAVVPRTRTLIRWMRDSVSHLYSFADIIATLEPFLVESENVTFQHWKEIRKYLVEKIRKYVGTLSTSRKEFGAIKAIKGANANPPNRILSSLKEKKEFDAYFLDLYNFAKSNVDQEKSKPTLPDMSTSSETLHTLLTLDGAEAYSAILNLYLLEYLTIPESVVGMMKMPDIKSDESTAMRNAECERRFIAKKYKSVAELRKDDNTSDVFYDKEYDDTPYHLVDKYKDEKKRFRGEEEFREFFTETLIQKHDCPAHLALPLANTILAKKKRVNAGEYAILEIRPTISDKLKTDRLKTDRLETEKDPESEKEKSEIEQEAEVRKYIEFYRRNHDKWELDKTVTMESFVDTNTLFCELSESCNKITEVNQCVPSDMAALQMRLSKRARMIEEFEDRVAKSFEEVADELREGLTRMRKQIRRNMALNETKLYKQNNYSYELGQYATSTKLINQSPHIDLRDKILAWSDFTERQDMIYTFVTKYCRQPNPHMKEDGHWLYCIETNTKLFPESIYLLAVGFIYNDYARTLDVLIRDVGQLSDDGDSIVDRYTGYTLRKIDYSSEEGFDESGFKITTNAVIEERDIGAVVLDALSSNAFKKYNVLESPIAQAAYNVFKTLSENMGIQKDSAESSIEEFVLRVSSEMMENREIVMSEEQYNEQLAANMNKKSTKMPYSTYSSQVLIFIVSCATFVGIQTLMPSFKTKKTFPGCVKSFAGYPLDANTENVSGLKYISCVLDKSKRASTLPWSAIEPLSVSTLLKNLKAFMINHICERQDVQKLYENKRDYLVNYPDQDIPADVDVKRWTHFLPPVVPFSVEANTVTGISEEYEKEFFQAILQGSAEQFKTLGIIKGKLLKHGYLTYDIIDHIVRKKQMILVSSGGSAFLENACCNEEGSKTDPISYFQKERPELTQVLQKAKKMESALMRVTNLTKAKTFFDPKSSRIVGASIPDTIISRTIYETYIHYCNFDNDAAIPSDLIPLAAKKPEYNRFASLDEKIAFMKKHGKIYSIEDFHSIMRVVNARNAVQLKPRKEIADLGGLNDMLIYFDEKNSNLVELRLRELLRKTLTEYDPKVAIHEERATTNKLNQYLKRANDGMAKTIVAFLDTHANLNLGKLEKISTFLETTSSWKLGETAITTVTRELYNMIYNVSKVYPNKTLANKFQTAIPRHWEYSVAHRKYLENATEAFYKEIASLANDSSNETFHQYLSSVVANLTDLVLFVEQIPVFAPLVRDGVKYWSLYSDETVLLLYQYGFLSAVHEYVILANDRRFLQMRAEEVKQNRRKRNVSGEPVEDVFENLDLAEDYGATSQVQQIHIVESDAAELKKTAATWLYAVLSREQDTKTAFNRDYKEIMDSTMLLKYKDKKHITDYLAKLSRDERRIEQNLRSHKIGRWNVGMQKGLYQYDKAVYDKEIAQWNAVDNEISDAIQTAIQTDQEGGEDVEDLERIERQQQSAEYDNGDGWDNLNEEYMDGIYYEEDAEMDD